MSRAETPRTEIYTLTMKPVGEAAPRNSVTVLDRKLRGRPASAFGTVFRQAVRADLVVKIGVNR